MNGIMIVILTFVFLLTESVGLELSGNGKTSPQGNATMSPSFRFLPQPLDHFDPLNSRFWDQRYYWNATNYVKDGPIFVMVGDEESIEGLWERQGTVGNLCAELHGFAFVLEHRFFGKSWPIKNTKTESLKFMTMEMALGDLARFVIHIKHKYDLQKSKVVVIGGSYSGELAIYFREKYPHLVDVVWATSSPILYKYDFPDYMEFVGDVIRGVSQKCYDVIKEGFRTLVGLTSAGVGCDISGTQSRACDPSSPPESCPTIQKTFKLCSEYENPSRDDVANLLEQLVQGFTQIVQFNGELKNHSVQHMCSSVFENEKTGLSPIQKIAHFTDVMNDLNQVPCIDFLESRFCSQFSGTEIEAITSSFMSSLVSRSWFWMVCTQVGSLQTIKGRKQPFGENTFFASNFVKRCQCAFGEKFTEHFIRQRVKTNLDQVFGGSRLAKRITRVIFVNGQKDPWSPLGILFQNQTSAENKVVYIPGASHCMDTISPTPQDSPHLIAARQQIRKQIKAWLRIAV